MTLPCQQAKEPAVRNSGVRDPKSIRWVVIHSAEALSALSVASYFASPSAAGSAHVVVDDKRCLITLPLNVIPWGAPGANTRGYHIELAGRAAWSREQWLAHPSMLKKAAEVVAFICARFDIPARWVGPWGLRALRPGITTHADVSRAFRRSDHWDPGPFFPKDYFLQHVRAALVSYKIP